jgi:hypothetical protein
LSAGFLSFCSCFWRFAKRAQIDRSLSEIEKLGDNIALRALSETFRPARLVKIFTSGRAQVVCDDGNRTDDCARKINGRLMAD